MTEQTYHFQFDRRIHPKDLETTFMLSVLAVESLHGRTRVWMDRGDFRLEAQARRCTIDPETQVGRDLARIFAGYAMTIHGKHAMRIRRGAPADCGAAGRCGGGRMGGAR